MKCFNCLRKTYERYEYMKMTTPIKMKRALKDNNKYNKIYNTNVFFCFLCYFAKRQHAEAIVFFVPTNNIRIKLPPTSIGLEVRQVRICQVPYSSKLFHSNFTLIELHFLRFNRFSTVTFCI